MPKLLCKNVIKNGQGNMSAPDPSQPSKANHEYFNTSEVHKTILKQTL